MTIERKRGFTLIELLMVIAIISLLMGMVMTMMSSARSSAMKSATKAMMGKIDTALRLFKNEIGAYPWQVAYADVAAGEAPTNHLAWHLGSTMTKQQRLDLYDDQDTAANQFRYTCIDPANGWYTERTALLKEPAYRISRLLPANHDTSGGWDSATKNIAITRILNRFAEERARLAIAIGNTGVSGPRISGGYDASATALVASPTAQGWASDYLGGEIEARYRQGDTLLDGWKRPLAYIANTLPAARGTTTTQAGVNIAGFDTTPYGLGAQGRIQLWPLGTGSHQTPTDPLHFPDGGNLLHSDARFYARPGLEQEFELISAGADGRMDWMRDAAVNRDNVLGGDYLRDLR